MLSVLLPYRDAGETVALAVRSVLADPALGELLAIDDGSTDSGPAQLQAICGEDSRVRLMQSGGVGVAGALAAGLAEARGELIGRMDADDWSHPERLTLTVRELDRSSPRVAVLGTRVNTVGAGEGLARYVAWQNSLLSEADHRRELFVEAPLCHPSVVMRRAALLEVGGYREAPWPQDYDLWLRFAAAGYGMRKLDQTLLEWRHRADRVTFTHPLCQKPRFDQARAHYLAPLLRERSFVIWGAGRTGRSFARALGAAGFEPAAFYDIDPNKIGRTMRGRPILRAEDCLRESRLVLVAVGARGARQTVNDRLRSANKRAPDDFLCVA